MSALLALLLLALGGSAAHPEPLMEAVSRGDLAQIRALLSQGTDPNRSRSNGWTPLMAAAQAGRLEAAALLLSAGADADAHDRLGRTPLDVAEANGQAEIVRLLRDRGAIGSGKSPGDTVCVLKWGGRGFCGPIERVDGGRYLVRIARVEGCESGCLADADCSGGEDITGPAASAGRSVWVRNSCLARTYPGSGSSGR